MRYTRLEVPCKVLNLKSNMLLKFIIIIPLAAIILGSICVKFLIKPYIGEFNKQGIINVSKPINIPVINNMFFLQAGIFSTEDNANILANAIEKKGFSPFVVEDKSKYRVIINFSDDKKLLANDIVKLKEMGYNTIVNTINLQAESNVARQEVSTMKDYVKYINNVVVIQYEAIKNYDTRKSSYNEELSGILSELSKKINDIKGLDADTQHVKKILDFNEVFMSNYEQYIKNLENKNINASSRNLIEETLLVAELCKYISQIN
jgi:hypothetical protein